MSEQNIISAVAASNGTNYLLADATKSAVSVDMVKTDVNLQHISQEDYERLVEESATVSNWVYFVSSEYEDAYGQQIKNMAPGTDLSDAVNLEQLTEVSSRAYDTYTQSEVDQKIASAQYFKKYVVQTLPPVADADVRGIYLVPSSDPETQNTYDEYVIVGEGSSKAWEKIGAKDIDLSGYKTKQTAVPSPTASGSATAFIDTVSQDENGVITATKKNVQAASTSLAGIVQLNNTLTSTSTTQAATANAVRALNNAKVENTIKVAGQALTADVTAATISSAIGLSRYLTAVPSDYKTYAQTKQSLSGDGYATQDQLNEKSTVSVDNVKADVNLQHISQDDYEQLVVDDEVLSNSLYIVSSDYVETYGQQIKNVAGPTDLSDAVNKEYVDSNFQPAGNYLTAVPSDYKTYAATLSSLSSTYSLTSHTHSGYVPTSRKINGTQLTGDVNVGTITGITMNGASKGTSGNVNLGTVLTAHQSLTAYYTKADLTGTSGVLKGYSLTSHTHNNYVPTSRTVAGQQLTANVTAATISSAIGLGGYYTKTDLTGSSGVLKNYSLTSHTHSQYLTAVPSTYKTYLDTKQSLSSDGYATQAQLSAKSAVSVDGDHADVNMVHISLDDYSDKLIGDEILSNELYIVSSDYVETYGQQIKNVADPTDLSDAVNKEYVDSNFQPAGNYLTAVPSTYKTYTDTKTQLGTDGFKTYAATLSSLSSTYSLTSHTHTSYVPTSRTVAGQQLTANVTAATISTAIGLGNYSLTSHTHSNYVPTSRTVAGKALTANITAAEISSAIGLDNYSLTSHTHAGYVPTSRKINGTQLTADLNVGTVTGIKMNGASKGSSGVVDLGTVLTAHQSLDSCLKNTGSQTIFSCHTLNLRSNTMDSTVVPESSVQSPRIQLQDKNAYSVGFILCDRQTSGRQSLIMRARQTIDGVDSYADIGVAVNADGTKYAYCPTPASSANNTSIATTAWVRSRMSGDYVSKAALTAAVAAVGAVPSGDGATLSAVITKFNQLVAALTALAT